MGIVSDVLRRLLDNYYINQKQGSRAATTAVGRDELKTRLKKFESHSMALARLARQNVSYTSKE
ncbi:hypothetical protein DYY65_08100 [Nitrososphaera sp. AFS]|nr:hypothetical protein [Nitrososphaera sp. AFS]